MRRDFDEAKLEDEQTSSEERLVLHSVESVQQLVSTPRVKTRPRSNTISTLQNVQVNSLRKRIKELESEIKAQRKRFWKTQDRNSQTHIQVKRRVSIDFAGAITAGKKEIEKLNEKIKELQRNLDTAKEASEKELDRVKAKFDIERAGFLEKLNSLENDLASQKQTKLDLESKLIVEVGKNGELSASLSEQKSQCQELQVNTERLGRGKALLLNHVKALNKDQYVVRVMDAVSLQQSKFRVSTDWNVEYLKNILRAVYVSDEDFNKFDLELYQGKQETSSPLTSLNFQKSSSTEYEGEYDELQSAMNCKPEDLLLPIVDIYLKLIPKPKPEISAFCMVAIEPEAISEPEILDKNQGCCIIS